ncbi:HGL316Wp [Eremothecium sinecaudum]|uniref:HGL316Wp n=1 Tax=Eremothecium sinecaudum TaxID=45286 RepID=A0A0X8HV25_9SACH|nr:HGL316Wp [Eremothecium sinecaudum]AMD22024.1 HGL316Wp [Eremothecium sinecaudum]
MFGITFFVLKRMPRVFTLMFSFITVFLTVFLLLGCHDPAQHSTYVTRYQFNKASPLYPVIQNSFAADNATKGLEKVRVYVGYLGVCVRDIPPAYSSESIACFGRKNFTSSPLYDALNIKVFNIPSAKSEDSKNTQLNMLELAHIQVADVMQPYLLSACTILTLLMFFMIVYVLIPMLPSKRVFHIGLVAITPVLVILFSASSIWTHVASTSAKRLIPQASMDIIAISKGKKASSMTWLSCILIILNCIILWAVYIKDRRNEDDEPPQRAEYNKYSRNDYGRYPSDGSTIESKR